MTPLKTLQESIIYRNPDPGHEAICAFQPNVVPLSDNELLCFCRIGQAFYSADGRIGQMRSTDGGSTWVEEGLAWDPANDDVHHSYNAPHATRLRDGTLIMLASRFEVSATDPLRFNPKTGGSKPSEKILLRSRDNGQVWSEPQILDLPAEGVVDVPSSVIELNDGRWFLACELWKTWHDPSPLHIKGFACFSEDEGRTWGKRVDFPSASDTSKMYSHSRYTGMVDGRIGALQWTQSIGGQENYDLHYVVSDEAATQWSRPRPTGIPAQTSWMVDSGKGELVVTYSDREGMTPGVKVALSRDEGNSWDLQSQVMVWDAVGQEFLGTSHKPSYPASHENIAFGKPHTARLPGGDILSSWWCTQSCVTHIRAARLVVA